MLCDINIENVAVIEKANASFGTGFNVLTGETGAGKSILIDSINAILGNRTSKDIVRSGAEKAKIWATFSNVPEDIQKSLEDAGYTVEDELLIQREISAEGKSVCRINNMPATAGFLKDLCGGLINIHGQHDNQSLLNPAKHIHILDSFAQNESLLGRYKMEYEAWRKAKAELKNLNIDDDEKKRRIDFLKYEIEEIEAAELVSGEYEELVEKRDIIRNSQHILEALNITYIALAGDEDETGAAMMLSNAARELESVASYSKEIAEYTESLSDMYYSAKEIASDIQSMLSGFEFNARELDDVESRLDLIYRLEQKYAKGVDSIISYCENAKIQLEDIEFSTRRMNELENIIADLENKVYDYAAQLTASRQNAFSALNSSIIKALEFLNMPGIRLELNILESSPGSTGRDELEFYISTNPGETPKPMSKIASGGELSRIMLAFKGALADRDDIPTVIYDEIDTGISGLASGRIGRMLKATAKGRQVICVTHTAQVAAYAENHLLIEKSVSDGRTFTDIRTLSTDERASELARIISGDNASETIKASAKEMLEKAMKS